MVSSIDGNIALKCNYNDGGSETGLVGFSDTCSNAAILANVHEKRPWCSHPDNDCPNTRIADSQVIAQIALATKARFFGNGSGSHGHASSD